MGYYPTVPEPRNRSVLCWQFHLAKTIHSPPTGLSRRSGRSEERTRAKRNAHGWVRVGPEWQTSRIPMLFLLFALVLMIQNSRSGGPVFALALRRDTQARRGRRQRETDPHTGPRNFHLPADGRVAMMYPCLLIPTEEKT